MRALLNKIAQERKIVFSVVFALALVGAATVSQGFFTDSRVTSAQIFNSQNNNNNGGWSNTNNNEGGGKGGEGSENTRGGGSGSAELCGFAWGATAEQITPQMGVGWVSFNSKDCDIDGNGVVDGSDTSKGASAQCPSGRIPRYYVSVDSSSNLVGYAWSSNVGWLKFGGLSNFPKSGGGNDPQNARINGDGSVTGWARFCAGTESGTCSNFTSRPDGWDGWVSLRGTSPAYGVKLNQDNFSGYSWGSAVVGWLNWNAGTGNNVHYCVSAPTQTLVVNLSASPSTGPVVLHTQLTANYQITSAQQKMLAQVGGTPSYKFKCNASDDWSPAQVTNTYDCSYSQPATFYYPRAQVTIGTLSSEGSAEVHTDSQAPQGTLSAVCSVTRPAFVGYPVTWTVTLQSLSVGPYDYQFAFSDGQGDTTRIDSNNSVEQVVTTYTSPGNRTLTATVTDSANPLPVVVNCSQSTNVIVKPTIIPI